MWFACFFESMCVVGVVLILHNHTHHFLRISYSQTTLTTNNQTSTQAKSLHNLFHRQWLIPRHLLKDNLRHATTHPTRRSARIRQRLRQGSVALHLHSSQLPRLRLDVEGNTPHQTPNERIVLHRWNRRLQHHESLQ